MNKTILWIIGGIAAVGIAVAVISVTGHKKSPVVQNQQDSESVTTTTDSNASGTPAQGGKKMAFSRFVAQGGTYKCTVDQYLENYSIKTSGTVYLDAGKIRGSFSTTVAGQKIDAWTIVRDGFAYSWTSLVKTGYKTPVVNADTNASSSVSVSGNTYSFNLDQIGDYNCVDWKADGSVFLVPVDITFQEIKN
jgi:hypothetical protein